MYRISTFSFFLAGYLGATFVIYKVWNSLQQDYERLPRLTFKSALLATAIWGAMFVLVLTMISGARELMTPGAWERNGAVYKLKEPTIEEITPADEEAARIERRQKLERLQGQLWVYALQHEGKFPQSIEESDFPSEAWTVPRQFEIQYVYYGGLQPGGQSAAKPLVVEPGIVDSSRYVMFTDGSMALLDGQELQKLLPDSGSDQPESSDQSENSSDE
ncbi:MAG: hypothetical protein CMJ46_09425 [Planctomyces sp.]|nr:hypothetical protein [Planctomyces sp.]